MRSLHDEPSLDALVKSGVGLVTRSAPHEEDCHFRRVLNELPAAIYLTDAEGHIVYYNEAAVALWGRRPALGNSRWCGAWKLYTTDGRVMAHDDCPMAVAIKEKRPVRGTEAISERPDGTRVAFMPYPTPLFDDDGQLVGAANILVDVTERRFTEHHARRLASIVESSDDAIISENLDGIIESWNRGAERLFGYTAKEAIGKPVEILMPPDRPDDARSIIERIRGGESVDHYETVRRAKDGRLIDVSLTVSPIRDDFGCIVAASKIARDITDRRKAQEQQRLVLGEMKHRIKNTLATVQGMVRQTLKSVRADERSAFLSRLRSLASAHDLLTDEDWSRARLTNVIERAMGPFQELHLERVQMHGCDDIWLSSERSLLLTMALHELATNAVKYGALSNRDGSVEIRWERNDEKSLVLVWRESGGPPVQAPARSGFGSRLLERTLKSLGSAEIKYEPAGVVCSVTVAV